MAHETSNIDSLVLRRKTLSNGLELAMKFYFSEVCLTHLHTESVNIAYIFPAFSPSNF